MSSASQQAGAPEPFSAGRSLMRAIARVASWLRPRRTPTFALLMVGALAVAAIAGVSARLFLPLHIEPAVDLDIEPGTSPGAVARSLERSGVIRDAWTFVAFARLLGSDREIRYGLHRFEGEMNANAVLSELVRAPQPTVRVTIHEGLTLTEAGALLEKAGLFSADTYVEAACDEAFVAETGAAETAFCSEGYLFPDTYAFTPGMTAESVVRLQHARFRSVLQSLLTEHTADGTLHTHDFEEDDIRELVILASIVQREAFNEAEQALVAAVFHNRLRIGMKLQADPTIIYGLKLDGRWDGNIRRVHLRENAPYNSYYHYGLPPGPICNPGRGALQAALHPADSDFLFFVAQPDGTHYFSTTLAEHRRAVERYQLGKK